MAAVITDKNTGKWKPTPKLVAKPKLTLAAQRGAKLLTAPLPKPKPKPSPAPKTPRTQATEAERRAAADAAARRARASQATGDTPGGGSSSKSSGDPTEEDYLKGDATYQATVSALAKQLENYQADIQAQKGRYGLDFDKGIQDLGYIAPAEGGEGAWNWDDTLTASGRGYQNQLNDFASRGMTQSSAYADAINNLQRSLMDQYTGMSTAKNTFETDLDRQLASTKDENTAAQQAARAEAIMRRAMQYGLAV